MILEKAILKMRIDIFKNRECKIIKNIPHGQIANLKILITFSLHFSLIAQKIKKQWNSHKIFVNSTAQRHFYLIHVVCNEVLKFCIDTGICI